MLKGVFTDIGFANAVKAQQVFGGHGYIAEWGMEQFVRDARISMIYEGANGIQALDLVGRKLPKDGGRAITAFFGEINGFPRRQQRRCRARALSRRPEDRLRPSAAGDDVADAECDGQSRQRRRRLQRLHASLRPDALGYMWARIVKAVLARKAKGEIDAELSTPNSTLAKFFNERMMPEAGAHLARLQPAQRPSWRCRRRRSKVPNVIASERSNRSGRC